MATRNSTERIALGDGGDEPSDGVFRLAVAVYAGALVAGVGSVTAVLTAFVPGGLPAVYAMGFAAGFVGGLAVTSADRRLPVRLGRTVGRRVALVAPVVPFVAAWIVPLEAPVGSVALASAIAVFASGYALSRLAGNRYVDAVTPDEPAQRWQWTPPSSAVRDTVSLAGYGLFAIGSVVGGDPVEALAWICLAGFWIADCLAGGRWSIGPWQDRCELRCHDVGLVRRGPYARSLVRWSDVDRVRLREGELVLDRGLRDVRFDRDELGDPEALLEAIDRRLAAAANR